MTTTESAELTFTAEFTEALSRLHRGDSLFLTGKAGTGKSTLIREFLATTEKKVVVAAPTGVAALNVAGHTIHSLFSFRPDTTLDEVRSGRYFPIRFAPVLRELDTLVIDEASMIRADLFDKLAAALQRYGPRRGAPFGGVQVVLVGDLFQLPPVVPDSEAEFFTTHYESPYFFSADCYTRERFPTIELTRVFRQVGDARLLEILAAIRAGTIDPPLLAELNTRTEADFRPPVNEFWLTLTTTNKSADRRNRDQLLQLEQPEITHRAAETGQLDGFDRPTERELAYKVGAQVMLLTNDGMGRWANDTIGQVVAHRIEDRKPVVTVKLPSGVRVDVRPHTWEITRPVVEAGVLHSEVVGTFTQLPFRLAWAITIHKGQGQTLDRLVVDLTGGTFADGQLYVALSRCTSMTGLVLRRPVAAKDLKTDLRVRRFLATGERAPACLGPVYLGVCTVGEQGWRDHPRPVEIALITDDGSEITTLINPERDLGAARADYAIAAADVLLAPTLPLAWAALAPYLAGRTPIGADIDHNLRYIDAELKRNGLAVAMPIGTDLNPAELAPADRDRLDAPRAIDRARAVRDIVVRRPGPPPSAGIFPPAAPVSGYLLCRGGGPDCFRADGIPPADKTSEQVLAEHLHATTAKIRPDDDTRALLRDLERRLGYPLLAPEHAQTSDDIAVVLVPGARVCFTGRFTDDTGNLWDRTELELLAQQYRLVPVATVTKTKCEALIAAEVGTQSGKAKQAVKFAKPIFAAQQFLTWAQSQ
ncbi:DEAD/DEAH box helicase [Nocardia sp. NBC_00416]|uniref:DEAD/DEAH box helicase n=1 Tax=Nocardia sp. NBC_00416 TaxID=2975991 RepID=UPI002E1C7398